jgi:4-oxalocrotonate tautomerase
MPTLTLKISPAQTLDRHQALAAALTQLTAQYLGKRAEVTAVMIDDMPRQRWYVAGRAVEGATVFLEISITAGTNTPQEKADFIEATFAELQRQIGAGQPLEPASYVIVRELPASDWGYGGLTQKARQLARHLARTQAA